MITHKFTCWSNQQVNLCVIIASGWIIKRIIHEDTVLVPRIKHIYHGWIIS